MSDLIKEVLMGKLFGSGTGSGGSSGGGDEKSLLDAFIENNLAEINSDAKEIASYALYNRTGTKKASFPEAESIRSYAFQGSGITELYIPKVNTLYSRAITYCNNLAEVRAPSVTTINDNALATMSSLARAYMPSLTGTARNTFYNSSGLVIADMGKVSQISGNCFWMTYPLRAIILRSETLCALSTTNAIVSCYYMLGETNASYNPDGLHDGYVYVPRSLIEEYPAATNWSALTLQYRALEDYTVDGTITGELDESKI